MTILQCFRHVFGLSAASEEALEASKVQRQQSVQRVLTLSDVALENDRDLSKAARELRHSASNALMKLRATRR